MRQIAPFKSCSLENVSWDSIRRACSLLKRGEIVAFPTETVYGLGVDATNGRAVAKLYAVKSRPSFNPLIVHVSALSKVMQLADLSQSAETLLATYSPGPLTLVLDKKTDCSIAENVCAGLDSIAVRIPGHPVALALLEMFDGPICAPSANISGMISPTSANHVRSNFGPSIKCILEGGTCQIGLESTIVDMRSMPPVILRPGAIGQRQIEDVIHFPVKVKACSGAPIAPGQLRRHYAPDIPLYKEVKKPHAGQAYLGFGNCGPCHINLSVTGDLMEAAANLFASLNHLQRGNYTSIAVAPIPNVDIGIAINDKLRRASAENDR